MAYSAAKNNENTRLPARRTELVGSLSSSLPPSSPILSTTQHRRKKQLSSSLVMSSAPISLPKSHIHRTPSELQLADNIRQAEYEDVRMYARLVVGMQNQCVASGYVHPLTRKSLQDIVKTKEANDQELEAMHLHQEEDADSGWDVNYIDDQDHQDQDGSAVTSSSLQQGQGACRLNAISPENIIKTQSGSSLISNSSVTNQEEYDESEEGVFSMEL